MSISPGDKLGPYEILAVVGAGGMGEVYRARDARLGREVALKISAERFSERFEREARAIAALNHPNICTLHDVGPNYLVMELVEGPTLADRISEGPLPMKEALAIASQIAEALGAAHEKGIVHRDLKPGNIKIKPDGTVKVLDFGLAKMCRAPGANEDATMTSTEAGVILGTAPYMAPEQARGRDVDTRADIWAFGVVVYEMLAGRRPFRGETVTDILAGIMKEEPDWNDVPVSVRRLLRSCLRKDPAQRLRHIGDAKLLIPDEDEAAAAATAAAPKSTATAAWLLAAVCAIGAAVAFWAPWRKAPPVLDTVRFQIQPSVNLASSGTFAVSPNGLRIAYAGMGDGGVSRIWVRSLDSLSDRPLAGTEMSTLPPTVFWSPDSRFIVFTSSGKLKKIDVSGGAPQTLCSLSGVFIGGSWSPENVILAGNSSGGILRVPVEGGAPIPVTALDPAQKDTQHTFPIFLPDGRHFLYLKASDEARNAGIYVGSLDAAPKQQSPKMLLPSSTFVLPLPGRLLYRRGSTLVTQEFDESRLELKGQPVPVAEPVGAYLALGFFSASRNGVLVYRAGAGDEVQLGWFDRTGKLAGRVGLASRYNSVALSPDGARAAISRTDPDRPTAWDLWLLDLARDTTMRFTFGPARADSPVWSADGSYVAYTSFGGGVGGLYRKLSNGTKEEETLLSATEARVPTSWSRDGRFMLFGQAEAQSGIDVWVLPLEKGGKPIRLLGSAFNEDEAQFSPNTNWIAYTSNESGKNEIYVRAFSEAAPGALDVPKWLVSNGGGSHPLWRGDGKELFYISPDGKMMSVVTGGGPAFHAALPAALFQLPPGFGNGDVTRDGQRFLFTIPAERGTQSPFTVVLNWIASLGR